MVHAQHTTILERYFKWVTISYYAIDVLLERVTQDVPILSDITVADRCLVDENLLFIRRWAAAAKMKMIMAAVAAELYQEIELSLP